MRVPSVILLLLAISLVSFSGCKARGKNGASQQVVSKGLFNRTARDRSVDGIRRSLATRGTAECDCYTCRMKRQNVKEYTIDQGYDPIDFESDPQINSTEQPISTIVDPNLGQPQFLIPNSTPTIQEIQGELIQDSELTNELPAEPKLDAIQKAPTPTLDVQPQLISPEASLEIEDKQQPTPVVQSNPIKASPVAARLKKEPSGTGPAVNGSIFRVRTRDNSVLEIDKPQPKRRETIWFAPVVEPATQPIQTPVEPVEPRQSKTVEPQPSETVVPKAVSAPVIEHEVKEAKPRKSIVLKARPVDHHMIYNSRQPAHAPIREARLISDSHFVQPVQRPRRTQLQFYPLPAQQPSHVSPAPAAPTQVAPAPVPPRAIANPQSNSQSFQPVPQQIEEPAELRLKANVVNAGNQPQVPELIAAPMARVIPQNNPMLKLKAAPTDNNPQQIPAIAKIYGERQDRAIVGSLQAPKGETQKGDASGMARLHTSPWQPMEADQNGSGQIQHSIRQLMIRPQQEANFSTDGIHR